MNAEASILARQIEHLEDRCDGLAARLAHVEAANQERFPSSVVGRLPASEPPVRSWREYRGMTVNELSERSGVAAEAVLAIEGGRDEVSPRDMAALGRALSIDLDLLVPWTEEGEPDRFRD